MKAVKEGTVRVTLPFKPYLEEKMWFALFGCDCSANSGDASSGEKYFRNCRK